MSSPKSQPLDFSELSHLLSRLPRRCRRPDRKEVAGVVSLTRRRTQKWYMVNNTFLYLLVYHEHVLSSKKCTYTYLH